MTQRCTECYLPPTWERHTQFAGVHPYCTYHAKREKDFGQQDGSTFWKQIKMNTPSMNTLDQATLLIERTREMQRIKESNMPAGAKRSAVNESIKLLNDIHDVHPSLEKILRDVTYEVMQHVKKAEAAMTPLALPTVATWLESAMGGPASSLVNVRNADHFKVTIDLLPLMKLVGGEWEALAKQHDA